MNLVRKFVTAAAGITALGSAVVGLGVSPASASPGGCVWGTDNCIYYHSNFTGGFNGDGGNDNYGNPGWYFAGCAGGNCDGDGQSIKNNAGSMYNMSGSWVRVFYNSNQSGPYIDIAPYTQESLVGTVVYNQNASQLFW
ncbi:peptidase inhibitor family I36 protein [Kitasatospora sp. LaBMicrA B282]|uniref:peptidase inhibitor family I36 protein n=1 Tax=Kitasatospora sp. LaBMicrA B282 TaxID=3420949 RepID=UPI003D1134CC